MAVDKKISELPVTPGIGANDISVLVNNGVDYQFSISLLLQYLTSNITSGASITFGAVLPQNNTGKNGDVFLKTSTGQFAQKKSGIWTVVYTLPEANGADGTLLYGAGNPAIALGKNNDSYIDTLSGIFYQKRDLNWQQAFSMQSGPPGPRGLAGETGLRGQDGRTILSGDTNPSNALGTEGDFYINTATYHFFGPKVWGDWGTPVNMFFQPVEPYAFKFLSGGSNPIIVDNWQTAFFENYGNGEFIVQFTDDDGNYQDRPDIGIKRILDRSGRLPIQTAISLDLPDYPDGRLIIKYSNLTLL
ncbi:hypothetical protein FPZ43_15665 [Mucilaginibacter pallidiroseus]|uniref:Uncharacterized protein n=1 Tax=Mucilaginibacter pallidiroseus TaxID=2599295 RepID=A0A563U325_9SPHI|nr:hypothetical protein [Mucilaginibacter pallidiroseus]TWR25722.1 hypothetical protein FPZ43_15665 [Mucilaginibacter pallidiroseus]